MIRPVIPDTRCGDITFHANGRIDITAHISAQLHLSEGDILDIAVSDDRIHEYYLYVKHRSGELLGRHCCRCHVVKGHGRYMRMFSKRLSSYMLNIAHVTEKVTFKTGETKHVPGIGEAMILITHTRIPQQTFQPKNLST